MADDGPGVWTAQAQQWTRVGPPLRPVPEDGAHLEAVARTLGMPRVLVLGVTPEMARLDWPKGTALLAIDRSADMAAAVWPGFPAPGEGVRIDDWRTMTLPPGSRDLIVGDGSFNVLRQPDELGAVLRLLREVLTPHGRLVVRVFVRPDADETAAAVVDAARAGRFASFHHFKLALLMALQPSTSEGIRTGDVWAWWARAGHTFEGFGEATGWPAAQVATLQAYQGQDTVLTFPRWDEVVGVADAAGWRLAAHTVPTYPSGERCPTLVLAPEDPS